jgi:hypothetical protein
MLEHTRTLFTGQSDEPCLGVDRLAPTNSEADPQRFADSGADPLLPAGSGAVLRFLGDSGTVLPTSTASEVGPRTPLAERGTCTFGAPLPRMTKDWRHRGAALASTPYGVHNVNAGVIDFALGERLCRESASGRSELSKRWRGEGSCPTGRLGGSSRVTP